MKKSNIFLKHIFGLRTVKTAIATALSIYIAEFIGLNNPLLAGISAIVSMTSSVFDSYRVSVNRMIGTIIGAILATIFQFFNIQSMVGIFLGVIILINILNYFNWKNSISLSCIVFIVIILYNPRLPSDPSYYMYSLYRVSDTALGLIIGFLINYFIAPPNRPKFLLNVYKKSLDEFEKAFLFQLAGGKNVYIEDLVDDINEINTELKSIKNDRKLFKNRNIKISDISSINYDFYAAFGFISQLSDTDSIPNVNDENIKNIKLYFGDSLVIIPTCKDEEYEQAYNYYLDELLQIFFKLRKNISEFEDNISNN